MTKGRTNLTKIPFLGAGAIGAAALAMVLGGGVASADDGVVGQTYAQAKATLGQQGLTPSSRGPVGSQGLGQLHRHPVRRALPASTGSATSPALR